MKDILLRNRRAFAKYVFASLFIVAEVVFSNYIYANLLGVVQTKDLDRFYFFAVIGVLQTFLSAGMFIFSRFLRIGFMRDTILYIRRAAFDKIISKSYRSFNRKLKSEYVSNLVNDINNFENGYFYSLLNIIFGFSVYSVSLIILFFLDLKLGVIMFFVSIFVFLINRTFQKRTVRLQEGVQRNNEKFTVNVSNTFSGLEILKLNRIEDRFLMNTMKEVARVEQKKYQFFVFTFWQRKFSYLMGTVIFIMLLLYILTFLTGDYDLSRLFFITTMANATIWPITETMPLLNDLKSHGNIIERILRKDEDEDREVGTKPFHLEDAIEVDGLTFSYEKKTIIEDTGFTIEKGKKYLLKGASGAGKSTLINLLSKVNDDYAGEILVDGVSLKEISEKSFNEHAGFIYQDVFLFEDTILENITLFKAYSDEDIASAVSGAGLTEFVEGKEHGLQEVIEENGRNISGGERQRISIARAIIRKPDILFADEITSALDETLGRLVEDTILSLPTTVVAISHRFYPGVTDKYDYVLEIVNGKVLQHTMEEYLKEVAV
ncbi:MAG TPA: ABC transporter ATP-binding protein [Clostridiaceae bacterium]|nr:ABC transporter ATP-binding protein [Clostridiaceae bacterium]